MPFTSGELASVANATLDFHIKQQPLSLGIQDKPLLSRIMESKKKFPGGKDYITRRVKDTYTTTVSGFEHDDTVGYGNPANILEAKFPWKLLHWGINFTMHELAKNAIHIVDSQDGADTVKPSNAEMVQLCDILEDKYEDMREGSQQDLNLMYWGDGSADPKKIPGVRSIVVDDPTAATVVGGIDQGTHLKWRNRANLTVTLGSSASENKLIAHYQNEFRQLRRYGGSPTVVLCGSDHLERLEEELRSKGSYTETGWASSGRTDISVSDLTFKNVPFVYDPTLDDLSYEKRAYALDLKAIHQRVMANEDQKKHTPARPENKYVFYKAVTHIAGLIAERRSSSGVYAFS